MIHCADVDVLIPYNVTSFYQNNARMIFYQVRDAIPRRVFMPPRSTFESSPMSPTRVSLPQSFRSFSLMLESHATVSDAREPVE